ncbi:hypothetical protein COU53_02345 [Candidatus Pacearchaeota archaeon CG10_big_fil_rev_8_21_14_0_10_30_48]|nr:MAG: hypothetical protein COU53_02345 [Candidatus Pacearchaeota archaeon CG10_big_fil_rev_8_21_14_0_10_30_48]
MMPKNTKKILLYLLKNFELNNINQISKKLEISVGSAFKILKKLEEENIVFVVNLGNAKYYKLNLESRETIKFCELLLLEEKRNLKGYAKIYSDEIENFKNADLIILFGSILRKKEFNDIDVLFITKEIKSVTQFCLDISKTKSKPVVPLIMKREDLINELKIKKDSILDVMRSGVVLKGESIFLEVIKNVKA